MSATQDEEVAVGEDLARKQVDAFMAHLVERLEIDEEKVKRAVQAQTRNGKLYVTWSVVLSVLIAILGYLFLDKMSALDRERDKVEKRIERVEERQNDVRERVRLLEQQAHTK